MPLSSRLVQFTALLLVLHWVTAIAAQEKVATKELVEVSRWKTKLNMFNDLLLSEDGSTLVVQATLGTTEGWDVSKKQRLWKMETDSYAHQINDEDDEEFLWVDQTKSPPAIVHTGLRDGKERSRTPLKDANAKLWNVEFGLGPMPQFGAQAEYKSGPHVLSFSLATGEVETVFKMPKLDGNQTEIEGLGVSANCKQFLLTVSGGLLLCNDAGQVLQRFKTKSNVARIRFLPDGVHALAVDSTFGSPVYFLELKTGKVKEVKEHRYGTESLEVSYDGKWAISGGRCRMAAERNYYWRTKKEEGGEVVLWDLAKQQPVVKLNPFVDSVEGVAISADGRFVAAAETGDTDGQIVVYEVKGKQ